MWFILLGGMKRIDSGNITYLLDFELGATSLWIGKLGLAKLAQVGKWEWLLYYVYVVFHSARQRIASKVFSFDLFCGNFRLNTGL